MTDVLVLTLSPTIRAGGGAERRFARVVAHLNDQGHNVVFAGPASLLRDLDQLGATRPKTFIAVDWPVATLGRLRRLMTETSTRLVHLPLLEARMLPLLLQLRGARDVVVTASMALSLVGADGPVPLRTRLVARILLDRADAVDSLYERFTTRVQGRLGTKVVTAPCSFTDVRRFVPLEKEPLVVFAGRLSDEKDPLLFVEALHRLAGTTAAGWRAVLAGDGPLLGRVEAAVADAGLADRVQVGPLPDLASTLGRAAVFASLQRHENYPSQSLLEAMACGCAVVATDVGETRRLVDADVGLLVPPADPGTLARALGILLSDLPRAAALGAAGRRRVLRHHTVERFAAHIVSLWEHAAARGTAGKP